MHTFLPWEDIRQSEHMDFFSHCTADLQLPNLASFGREEVVMANWILFLKL